MTLTIIFFMIGLIEINQTELVVRLFKIGVIATLISDTTLNTIPSMFDGFIQLSMDISNVIMKISMYDPKTSRELLPFPELNNVFSAYDAVMEMALSKGFNVKIWSLLFTSKFYLIIGIYVCIIIMFIAMLRSLVQYIMSLFLLALLLIILPIFLVTILFKQTIHLFENWLGQFIASCLMIIIVTTTVALMLSLIVTQLQDLLYYTVCWKSIWKWEILGITIIDFRFWKPDDWTQFSNAATALRFFYVLVSCVLFRVYMDYVPELVDALGGAARRPLSGMYMGSAGAPGIIKSFENFMKEVYDTDFYKALDKAVLSPVKQGVMKRLSPVYYIDKGVSKLGVKEGTVMKGVSKAYKEISEVIGGYTDERGITHRGIWDSFTSNPENEGLGIVDIGKEEEKGKASWKEFERRYGKYGYKLIGKGIVGGAQLAWKGGKLVGKGAVEGARLARRGIEELWERRKSMDQRNKELIQKVLAEDKVILDGRVQGLNERYEKLKNEKTKLTPESSEEDLRNYKERLKAFEGDRELIKQELKLYEEQERVLSGGLSDYEIQEGLNQVQNEMDNKVSIIKNKEENFSRFQEQLGKNIQGLEERGAKLEEKKIELEGRRVELEEKKNTLDKDIEDLAIQKNKQIEKLAKKDPLSAAVEMEKLEKDYTAKEYGLKQKYVSEEQKLEREYSEMEIERRKLDDDYSIAIQAYKIEHDEFVQEVEKTKGEVNNLQFVYDEQRTELDRYNKEFEDMWSSQDLTKDIPDEVIQGKPEEEQDLPKGERDEVVQEDMKDKVQEGDEGIQKDIEEAKIIQEDEKDNVKKDEPEVMHEEVHEEVEVPQDVGTVQESVEREVQENVRDDVKQDEPEIIQEEAKGEQSALEKINEIEEVAKKSEEEIHRLEKLQKALKEEMRKIK